MKECLILNKKNKEIVLTYLIVITIVLFGYFFMVAFKAETFDESFFQNFYLYFFLFELGIYSVLITLWQLDELEFKSLIVQVFLFTISSLPQLALIVLTNRMNGIYLLLPLLVQYIWGMCILSIKGLMKIKGLDEFKVHLTLKMFILTVMIFSLVFLYFYYHYKSLVLVSIFDKRMPVVFFLNPLITAAGIIKTYIGGTNYLGYKPIFWFSIFWIGVVFLINLSKKHSLSR